MRERIVGKLKADTLTLVLAGLLAVAAVWLIVDQFAGAKNPLADRLFFLALGLLLGNELRLIGATGRRGAP
jgi:hypothetical protein